MDKFSIDNSPEHQPRLRIEPTGRRESSAVPRGGMIAAGGGELHLLDYVKVFSKRRWTGTTAFLLVFVSVMLYTFIATPVYEAKSRLLIEAENQNVVNIKQVVDEDQTRADYYQTQYNILQSRALARRTLDQLKLWNTPPFGGANPGGFSLKKAGAAAADAVVSYVSGSLSRKYDSPNAADETFAQSRAIDAFLANLTVAPIRNSRLVDVKYELPDPVIATRIVNTLTKGYIEQDLEYKFMASKEANDWLGDRLAEQRKAVEAAEAKLQQYREQNDAISLEDRQNIVVQKLGDLNAAVTRAKTDRIQKESVYNQLRDAQNNPAVLDTFPAILTNSFIQQQKAELADLQKQYAAASERLGDKHPDIIRLKSAIQISQSKLNGEIAKVVQSVKSEYLAAVAQEDSLTTALNQQKAEALSMNRKGIDYSVLARDVESNKQLYQNLLQRAKETGVAGELRTSNVRIVDAAERPRRPVSPEKGLNLLFALFGGSALACGLVFFFEYLDSRIKNPDEIRLHLGLAHLGLVPAVEVTNGRGYPLINSPVPASFSEAIRTVRTNVLFSSAHEGARSVVVTSTGPGEGKSVIAANLAISLAQAGQRVLLMDADMRKPKVHSIFGYAQEPGLSNLLVGTSKASEVVKRSSVSGLWVLVAGRVPPNPAELLSSQRSKDFVESLKNHFDWIIIDSPPVMAVTDAALVAHYVSGVLFVVGAEMTSRHTARRALDHLENVHAKFVGAVLNRVDLERNAYYYSDYYRREYASYYTNAS